MASQPGKQQLKYTYYQYLIKQRQQANEISSGNIIYHDKQFTKNYAEN